MFVYIYFFLAWPLSYQLLKWPSKQGDKFIKFIFQDLSFFVHFDHVYMVLRLQDMAAAV